MDTFDDNVPTAPDPRLETARRVLLLGGFLAAAWLALRPADALLRVGAVDFARLQREHGDRLAADLAMMGRAGGVHIDPREPQLNNPPRMTLEQFIAEQTRNRLLEVSSPAWTELRSTVRQVLSGQSTALSRHLGIQRASRYLYFQTSALPFNEIAYRFDDENRFFYVAVLDQGSVSFLEVLFSPPSSAYRDAPRWLLFPGRKYAAWCLIGALMAYTLIPWPRRGSRELRYPMVTAVVVPDFLGVGMATFFFALPILIVTSNSSSPNTGGLLDFNGGWGALTLVLWTFALFGVAISAAALRYGTYSLTLLPEGFRVRTLLGADDYRFADMARVEPVTDALPRWQRVGGLVLGMLNWRAMGPVLLAAARSSGGIAIHCRDGRQLNIWTTDLRESARVFRALRNAGVPLDDELSRIIDEEMIEAASTPPEDEGLDPGRGGRIAALVLLALAVGGALAWQFRPEPTRTVVRERHYTDAQMAHRAELLQQMQEVAAEMKQVTSLPPDASAAERTRSLNALDTLMKRHDELEQQYNAIEPMEEQ